MIYVQGYSGCGISVFPSSRPDAHLSPYILEKASKDKKYIPRLLKQLEKQQQFSSLNKLDDVFAPQILYKKVGSITEFGGDASAGGGDDVHLQEASFGMKFELHVDALTYLERCGVDKIRRFGGVLADIVSQYVANSTMQLVPARVFTAKLQEVLRNTSVNVHIVPKSRRERLTQEVFPSMIKFADSHVATGCSEPSGLLLPVGACHGDLTLSNVLVKPSQINPQTGKPTLERFVLIDFLDAFVESPICDVAKLAQDLVYGWSLRMHTAPMDALKLASVFKAIHEQHISARFQQEPRFQRTLGEERFFYAAIGANVIAVVVIAWYACEKISRDTEWARCWHPQQSIRSGPYLPLPRRQYGASSPHMVPHAAGASDSAYC